MGNRRRPVRGYWYCERAALANIYERVVRQPEQAHMESAELHFRAGMDFFVSAHGHGIVAGMEKQCTRTGKEKRGMDVCISVVSQFLVVDPVFPLPFAGSGFCRNHPPARGHFYNHAAVCTYFAPGIVAHGSLHIVGEFCIHPQLHDLGDESVKHVRRGRNPFRRSQLYIQTKLITESMPAKTSPTSSKIHFP